MFLTWKSCQTAPVGIDLRLFLVRVHALPTMPADVGAAEVTRGLAAVAVVRKHDVLMVERLPLVESWVASLALTSATESSRVPARPTGA